MIHLGVTNLHKRFGGLHVLKGLSFEINGPELIGLIGPNGAGKTTLTNVLDGAIKPNSGTVYLNGQRIDQLQPYDVALAGPRRTFQVTRSFRRLSVLENLYVPALAMGRPDGKAAVHDRAMEVLRFLTMEHLRNTRSPLQRSRIARSLCNSSSYRATRRSAGRSNRCRSWVAVGGLRYSGQTLRSSFNVSPGAMLRRS